MKDLPRITQHNISEVLAFFSVLSSMPDEVFGCFFVRSHHAIRTSFSASYDHSGDLSCGTCRNIHAHRLRIGSVGADKNRIQTDGIRFGRSIPRNRFVKLCRARADGGFQTRGKRHQRFRRRTRNIHHHNHRGRQRRRPCGSEYGQLAISSGEKIPASSSETHPAE